MCDAIHERVATRLSHLVTPIFAVRDGIPADKVMLDLWDTHEIASWPQPPKALLHMHDPRIMQQHWERLMAVLRDPVDEYLLPGGWKAFRVLGSAVFLRSPKGCFHPYLHEVDHGHVSLVHMADRKIMVTEIPYRFVWLRALCALATVYTAAINSISGRSKVWEYDPYVGWMYSVFERRIKSHCDMRQVRQRIRKFLQVEDRAWQMAHQLHSRTPVAGKVTLAAYNFAVRNQAQLDLVRKDAPHALPVYAAWSEVGGFAKSAQPVQALKHYIGHLGLGNRGWTLVLRDGMKLLDLVNQFYSGATANCVEDCLKIFVGLGVNRLPKPWVSQAMFSIYGNAHATRESYFDLLPKDLSNLAHVVRHCNKRSTPDEQGERDLIAVVDYVTTLNFPVLTRRQRQQGWGYLVRQAHAYFERITNKRLKAVKEWSVPFAEVTYRGLRLRALGNSVALLEEGDRMRNCLGNRIERYAKMDNLAVSVDRLSGKRCATAEYCLDKGQWRLRNAQGPMNRELDAELKAKLASFARLIKIPVNPSRVELKEIAQIPVSQEEQEHQKPVERPPVVSDLGVRFYNCEAGWIRMGISAGANTIEIQMSHLYDPIPALMEWMEAIVLGAEECSFDVDEEGSQVSFRGVKLECNSIHFQVGPEFQTPTINVKLSSYLLISTIYQAFVDFSESEEYKPREWESRCLADVIRDQGESSVEVWLDVMQNKTRRDVQKAFWKLDPVIVSGSRSASSKLRDHQSRFDTEALDHEVLELTGKPAVKGNYLQFRDFGEWVNLKSTAARRKYLLDCLMDHSVGSWSGCACAKLRSSPVEAWINAIRNALEQLPQP